MTDVNVPLLRKVLDHVTAHPEEWNQSLWGLRTECGTAYCIAGHALVMSGAEFEWDTAYGWSGDTIQTADGRDPHDAGAEALGLTDSQACELFAPHNDLRQIHQFAHQFTEGEIAIPDTLPDDS